MSAPETWPEQRGWLERMAQDERDLSRNDRLVITAALTRIDELTRACLAALQSNEWQHGTPCTCEACRVLRDVLAKAGA